MTPSSAPERRFDAPAPRAARAPAVPTDDSPAACRCCGRGNDAGRKFCKECGAPLHGPCPECGETVGLAERFCGGCGFHLEETFERRLQAAQAILNEGISLRAASQFTSAQHTLRRLAAESDPLVYALRRRAEQELKQCEADLRAAAERCEQLCIEAQAALDESDYDRAVTLLEQVPEGMRTDEVKLQWERARLFREESEQLVRTIRQALAAKQHLGLLPHVERLLVLKPNHPQAREMVDRLRVLEHRHQGQLRERNFELARRKLEECKYDEAVELLEQVSSDMLTPEAEKLLRYARETAWLARQLRTACLLTETLVRIGERLLKLQPADQGAAKAVEQLRQRRAASGSRFATPIRPAPDVCALGRPIEYPAPWKQILVEDTIAAALGQRSEQFYAAAGLALEGLGKGTIAPKLQVDAADRLWQRLSRAVRKRDPGMAWGIDLGTRSLKALRMRLRDDGRVVVDAAEYLTHERALSQPGVDVAQTIRNTWQRLATKHDLSAGRLCFNLAGQSLLTRSFKLPPVEPKKLPELMRFEAPRQIPVPIEKVAWDYHVFPSPNSGSLYDREAAFFAIQKQALHDRLTQLAALDVRPDLLQADSVAIYNTLAFEGQLPAPAGGETGDEEEPVTMALDVGADSTGVLVGHARSVWTRVIPFGGNDFTRALVKELTLTFDEAERQKRQPFASPAAHLVDCVMQGAMQAFAAELQRTMTYYATQQRRRNIARILLLGGGARLHGLLEGLWQGS